MPARSAAPTMGPAGGASTDSETAFALRCGLVAGGYAGVVFGSVDAMAVVLSGRYIPLVLPILIIGTYLLAGWTGGSLLGGLVGFPAGRSPRHRSTERQRAQIENAIVNTCLVVCTVMLLERMFCKSVEDLGSKLGLVSICAGCIGMVLSVVVGKHRPVRPSSLPCYTWKVLCIALFCIFRKPFHESYRAAAFGPVGLLANGAYLVLAVLIYLTGSMLLRRLLQREDQRRRFLRWTLATAVLGAVASSAVLASIAPRPFEPEERIVAKKLVPGGAGRANVVLIVLDTARADHLTPYGYPLDTTPNLAAFSKEAVVYSNAVAPSSWTYPSHASLFTGLMPTEHRAHYFRERGDDGLLVEHLDERYTTLAEILQEHGYATGAIVANTVPLRPDLGVAQGFEYYDIRPRAALDTAQARTLSPGLWLTRLFQRFTGRTLDGYVFRDAREINADALVWLDRAAGEPVFLFINYADPHEPYREHPDYRARLTVRGDGGEADSVSLPGWARHPRIPKEQWENIARYDGELAHVDASLGDLFRELRARGLYDESLIIVTSDHGEAFGEHGNLGHLNSVYQEEVWVPLIVRYPGGGVRDREEAYTSLISVFDIILNHLGIAPNAPQERQVHAAHLPGVLAELYLPRRLRDDSAQEMIHGLYRKDGIKAVMGSALHRRAELYDLRRDPLELDDLSTAHADLCQALGLRVSSWIETVQSALPETKPAYTMSDELRDRLRSLGYLD